MKNKNWKRGVGDKQDQKAFGEAGTVIVLAIAIAIVALICAPVMHL
jgi:hypothetical protein